jgi:hypothetical protein
MKIEMIIRGVMHDYSLPILSPGCVEEGLGLHVTLLFVYTSKV